MRASRNERGFTLIEIVVSLVVFSAVSLSTYYLAMDMLRAKRLAREYEALSQAVRAAAERIWDVFDAQVDGPPEACGDEDPVPLSTSFDTLPFAFTYACVQYGVRYPDEADEVSEDLYSVDVRLHPDREQIVLLSDDAMTFEIIALVRGE